jgi:hypothetical protein
LKKIVKYSFSLLMLALSAHTLASNTSGVHGPGVKEGDKSMQLRIALSPGDEDGEVDYWGYRLHYQQSFNDTLRGRIIMQYRARGELQYEYLRAELLYNFKKKEKDGMWASGVRFEVRQRRSDKPEQFAISWTNQWDLANGVRVRGIVSGSWQFGVENASSGTYIETRSSVSKKLDSGLRVGLEMFNDFGRLNDFGSFNDQGHQIGPMIGGSIGDVKYEFRYLFGVSNGARDNNLGLRFNKSF